MNEKTPAATVSRLAGLDVARGLAILGMVLVHFGLVMQAPATTGASAPPAGTGFAYLDLLDGRPTTLFMLLAGIGITLMASSRRERGGLTRLAARRGAFLLLLGFANLIFWPGDILRIYGVIFLFAGVLAASSTRRLVGWAAGFIGGFMILLLTLDYGVNWEWETLTYRNLWTLEGAVRNLTIDGFRSVFPWAGVVIIGMAIGQLALRDPRVQRQLAIVGGALWLIAEAGSRAILGRLLVDPTVSADETLREDVVALFGTASMPPQIVFLTAAGGLATAIIGACLILDRRCGGSLPMRALAATGQLAFTWYLGHIYLGVFVIYAAGWTSGPAAPLAVGLAYFVAIAALSVAWRGRGRRGPMEALLRRVCG